MRDCIDEYILSLRVMTPDQVAAVFYGMGLSWLTFPYWGAQAAAELQTKLAEAGDFWRLLEAKIPDEERYKHKRSTSVFQPPLRLLVPREESASQLADRVAALLRAQTEAIDWLVSG